MGHSRKIATCCYCGLRSELLIEELSISLSCASCGAPLQHMKSLPVECGQIKGRKKDKKGKKPKKDKVVYADPYAQARPAKYQPHPSRKTKKRKPWGVRLFKEVIDVVEDIFD